MYEITKSIILQELQNKFKLREWIPEKFAFLETIIPVYQIEPHLREWHIVSSGTFTITGTTMYTVITVPTDEKWSLRAFAGLFLTGNYNIGSVQLSRANSATAIYLEIEEHLNTKSWVHEFPEPIVLLAGDHIRVQCSAHTTNGGFEMRVDIDKEMVR